MFGLYSKILIELQYRAGATYKDEHVLYVHSNNFQVSSGLGTTDIR